MNIKKKISFYAHSTEAYLRYYANKKFHNIALTPFLVIILPTNGCNLKCEYCPETREQKTKYIPINQMYTLINQCIKEHVSFLTFSGGEPMLHPKFLDIAKFISKKNIVTNLNTNGTMITERNVHLLKNSFDFIRISLDGTERYHDSKCGVPGTFNKVIEGLELLVKHKGKAKIGINIVISDDNFYSIENLIKLVYPFVDFISILPEFNSLQHTNSYKAKTISKLKIKKLRKKIKNKIGNSESFFQFDDTKDIKNYCLAGKLFWCIAWDGNIYSCPYLLEKMPTINYQKNRISFRHLCYDNPIKYCSGCHATCAVEISRIYNMSPITLFKNILNFKKNFRL